MLVQQKIFTDWVQAKVLKVDEQDLVKSIMIWPFSPQEPQYRDDYPR